MNTLSFLYSVAAGLLGADPDIGIHHFDHSHVGNTDAFSLDHISPSDIFPTDIDFGTTVNTPPFNPNGTAIHFPSGDSFLSTFLGTNFADDNGGSGGGGGSGTGCGGCGIGPTGPNGGPTSDPDNVAFQANLSSKDSFGIGSGSIDDPNNTPVRTVGGGVDMYDMTREEHRDWVRRRHLEL